MKLLNMYISLNNQTILTAFMFLFITHGTWALTKVEHTVVPKKVRLHDYYYITKPT